MRTDDVPKIVFTAHKPNTIFSSQILLALS